MPEEKSNPLPWFELRDVIYATALPMLAIVAWVTPQRSWTKLSRGLVNILLLGPDAMGKTLLRRIEAALRSVDLGVSPRWICQSYVANKLILQFEYFRSLLPGGWSCSICLKGREKLEDALARGTGAILWVTPSSSSDLVVKRCFSEHGYLISHLSDLTHGYSASRFGVKFINGANRLVEDRYLGNRIILNRGSPSAAVREMQRRISQGEIVSITAVENKRGKSTEVPLFDCRLPLGIGAVVIARKTGVPLLPVFTTREADGSYKVEISNPLISQPEATQDILQRFANLVEAHARAVPEQWFGWTHLRCGTQHVAGNRTLWDWINKAPVTNRTAPPSVE